MRALAYLTLLVLLVASIVTGEIGIALALGGVKASIVGLEFMELRQAARGHALGFVAGMVVVTGILIAVTGAA